MPGQSPRFAEKLALGMMVWCRSRMTSLVGTDVTSFASDPSARSAPPRLPRVLKAPPIIGVLPQFLRNPTALLVRAAEEHPGEIVTLPVGPARVHLLTDPTQVQH